MCQKKDWPEHKKACGMKRFAPEAIAPAPAVRDEFIGCPSALPGFIRTPALWRQIFRLSKPDSQYSDYHVGKMLHSRTHTLSRTAHSSTTLNPAAPIR
jgi:hypothetical protein